MDRLLAANDIYAEHLNGILYFLCLTSYYLFKEPYDVTFLKTLKASKDTGLLAPVYKEKALARLHLVNNFINKNPLDYSSVINSLYENFKDSILASKCIDEQYISPFNFGTDCRVWNPWFGCFKITEACENCYVFPENTFKPVYYPFPYTDAKPGTCIAVCLKSDFFLRNADSIRPFAWQTIRNNPNLIFMIITKRIDRAVECLPADWGNGYDNVIICATVENQKRADERLPILLDLPVKHRWITCSPLLEQIQLTKYLKTGKIEHVEATGERECNKNLVRPTRYEWVADLSKQCAETNVRFSMLYLGHNFIMPDGTIMKEWSRWYRSKAADSLNLFNYKPITFNLKDLNITY